jgi:hypothetical protein
MSANLEQQYFFGESFVKTTRLSTRSCKTPKPQDFTEIKMVPRAGIEPATRGFSIRCSTN